MPATSPTINLLGDQDLGHSPAGRILSWATTYGRYIMITTEILVLLAFISRFRLDRQLTDLNEEISQKQAIIEANSGFEAEFRGYQERIQSIKTLVGSQSKLRDILEELLRLVPPDVHFTSLTLGDGKLTAKTTALTTNGFAQFLSHVSQMKVLQNIEVGDIKKNPLRGIEFQLSATIQKK